MDTLAQRQRTRFITAIAIAVAVIAVGLVSLAKGQYSMPVSTVIDIVLSGPTATNDNIDASVLWSVRMPRVIMSILVGAALAVSGALMQALFANPLAEPSVIGVSSGAGVGAAVAIVFGVNFAGTSTVAILAFASAIITAGVVYSMARVGGRTQVVSLILTGIAVNAVAGATISFLIFLAPTTAREQIQFWQMGSLNGAQWKHVIVVAPVIAIGLVAAFALRRQLDILALGDRAASHTGVDVPKLRVIALIVSTLLTAIAVSYGGIIGFVGLIVPHWLRIFLGASNVWLIPLSALGGAALLGSADIAARTVIAFADLPIGIFTAIVGGPVFFVLLRRTLKKGTQL